MKEYNASISMSYKGTKDDGDFSFKIDGTLDDFAQLTEALVNLSLLESIDGMKAKNLIVLLSSIAEMSKTARKEPKKKAEKKIAVNTKLENELLDKATPKFELWQSVTITEEAKKRTRMFEAKELKISAIHKRLNDANEVEIQYDLYGIFDVFGLETREDVSVLEKDVLPYPVE